MGIFNILYLVNISLCCIIGWFDVPACISILFILIVTYLYSRIGERNSVSYRFTLCPIVTFVYIVTALINSSCFSETEFFLASDPIRYIATAHNSYDYSLISNELSKAYLELADNNGLYNSIIRFLGIVCNTNGVVASSLLITLPQTLFGILTVQTVFRILNTIVSPEKAFKYTLIYSVCSLTLLYSGIIVRDIAIAFTYAVCIETVLKPFRLKGCFVIISMMLICIGFRLFSGLFLSVFLLYYLFFNVNSPIGKFFIYAASAVIIPLIFASAFVSQIVDKTNDEIDTYSQWQSDVSSNSDGFSSAIRNLPPGINNVALALYSQMNPFPPYSNLRNPDLTPSQTYMATLMTISAIWWFFISYTLLWLLFFKKGFKEFSLRYDVLYGIAVLLIVVSSTMHVDIRRLIPVYPIIFFLYVYATNSLYSKTTIKQIQTGLGATYLALNCIYLFFK